MYKKRIKRCLDFGIALIVLMLAAPLLVIILCLLIAMNNGRPFFTQLRPGLNEHIFRLYKFKTMNDKVDKTGKLLSDAKRLTPVGKFLRKTSIDELPQLINVLKGDMSLIGPRPLLIEYLSYYKSEEKVRHEIRPGITGWAQVNGRNASNWNDRLAADIYYYRNLSFKLDATIIYETIKSVLSGKDIIIDPNSSMDPLNIERHKSIGKEVSG